MFAQYIKEDFTVNELVGVLKWLRLKNKFLGTDYLVQLEEWQDEGYGDSTVKSCEDTLDGNP